MAKNIKVVIQCAASKVAGAGCMRDKNGARILFVADPDIAPTSKETRPAHPDGFAENKTTWRDKLLAYQNGVNPFELSPAWKLYNRDTYGNLVKKYGVKNVFILSAGWGLISAEFLTPNYDITFSKASDVEPYQRRGKNDYYQDLCMLPPTTDDLVFFGGISYQSLFYKLTKNYPGHRFIFYNSNKVPDEPRCTPVEYRIKKTTNWHYDCACAFINGKITLPTK